MLRAHTDEDVPSAWVAPMSRRDIGAIDECISPGAKAGVIVHDRYIEYNDSVQSVVVDSHKSLKGALKMSQSHPPRDPPICSVHKPWRTGS